MGSSENGGPPTPPHPVICMARFERDRRPRPPLVFTAIARWHERQGTAPDAIATPPHTRKIIPLRAIPRLLRDSHE